MINDVSTPKPRPWYREPWIWFLSVPPLATVVFWAAIFATTSAGTTPPLVVDDYAKIGLATHKSEERDAEARRLGVTGRLHVQRDEGRVSLALFGLEEGAPRQLMLRLTHPTDDRRDVNVELHRDSTGVYRAAIRRLPEGRRYVQLEPDDGNWRLAGVLSGTGEELSLQPKAAPGS